MSSLELPFEIGAVLEIAREAATLGKELQGNVRAEFKSDNTFVTAADRAIETLLRERLGALTPGWSLLGEEQGLEGAPDAPAWVIDPIDGTNNFVRDLPLWTVSIGAVRGGEAICGVIAAPVLNEISWAAKGQGAWRESGGVTKQIHAHARTELMHEDIIAYNTEVENAVDFSRVPGCMRNFGSVAYHLSLLARGSLSAAMARRHKLYDVAGGMAICNEAGCVAQYLDGRDWIADVTESKAAIPLLVAPPQTMELLKELLELKQSPTALLGHENNAVQTPARS
jgi:fructose-1,6-bisphosphatase/inositol monophosphatase family enzyme